MPDGNREHAARRDRLMRRLGKVSLLVLDDWGLQGFSSEGRRDRLEIVEQRRGRKYIMIVSQIPVERWPEMIGEPRRKCPTRTSVATVARLTSVQMSMIAAMVCPTLSAAS